MVEQVALVHMPSELAVFVALYRDLQNAKFLREQLLAGNTDFEYAFIDASMVGHPVDSRIGFC
jgi:EKC/KEOPS complex subunit CGI121/TPRKB